MERCFFCKGKVEKKAICHVYRWGEKVTTKWYIEGCYRRVHPEVNEAMSTTRLPVQQQHELEMSYGKPVGTHQH